MVVRMRHTKGHTRNRRSHHAIEAKNLATCKECGTKLISHQACATCGMYKGKQVVKIKIKKEKA